MDTIRKCFLKPGFSRSGGKYQNFIEEDNIPVAQLFPKYDIFSNLKEHALMDNGGLTEILILIVQINNLNTLNIIYWVYLMFVKNQEI